MYNSTMESGKFVLRIDPKLHHELKLEALKNKESLNSLCVKKLTTGSDNINQSGLSDVIEKIIKTFNPKGVVLFGSVARGEQTQKSDIDLLIVMDDDELISRDLYQLWDKAFKTEEQFSPQFVHVPRQGDVVGSIWLETSIDGDVLFDRTGDIKAVYRRIRADIANGHYVRKLSHGHSYWIKQVLDAK